MDAIEALGKLKSTDAVEPLMAVARDGTQEPQVVRKAAQALGEIGDPRAVPTLVHLLDQERGPVTFYPEASFALFQIGKPSTDALLPVLRGEDSALKRLS